MSISVRVRVLIFDNENIRQISYAKYKRLFRGDKNERIPEYADQRIKTAVVYVKTENRNLVDIIKIDYSYITIDKEGKFDQHERQEKMIDAMRMMSIPTIDESPSNIIDSSSHFAQKTYRNKHLWSPTDNEVQKIKDKIFKQ